MAYGKADARRMKTSGHVLAKQPELGNDDKRNGREGGG